MSGNVARAPERLSAIIRCRLPADQQRWRPPLFPGSQKAADAGCICPIEQPWPGGFDFHEKCPIHEIEEQKQ